MENCIMCSTKLKFTNTPVFGAGKLSDGTGVCSDCFTKINEANPSVAFKLKKYSPIEVRNVLEEYESKKSNKNSRLNGIKSQIQALRLDDLSTYLGRKEINELPNILSLEEKIDNIVQGIYNNGQGILVSTNTRLIFVDKGLLYGLKVEDFPLDKITSIQYETGLLWGKIKIHTSGNIATIENVDKSSSRQFSEFIRNKISQPKETITPINSQINVIDQIEQLAKLKEKGILSEEEFSEQKKKLLEKL